MSKEEAKKLVKEASDLVPFGIYAVEKGNQIDLRNDKCKSITQLKALTRQYRQQGFKVYANKG
jgi:hypothetical protein